MQLQGYLGMQALGGQAMCRHRHAWRPGPEWSTQLQGWLVSPTTKAAQLVPDQVHGCHSEGEPHPGRSHQVHAWLSISRASASSSHSGCPAAGAGSAEH